MRILFFGFGLVLLTNLYGRAQQFARPNGDVTTASGVATVPTSVALFSVVDESTASDSDFIGLSGSGITRTVELSLSAIADPNSSIDHRIRYRCGRNNTSGSPTIKFDLYQGSTLIATTGTLPFTSATPTTSVYTLTSPEANAIGDYSDLRIRITLTSTAGGSGPRLYWLEFEVPAQSAGLRRRIINL